MSISHRPHVLLLDFGAVISKSLFETVASIETSFGVDAGTLAWHGPFNPDVDSLWQDMQRNVLSERDYWYTRVSELSSIVGEPLTIQDITRRSRPRIDDICRPEAVAAIATVQSNGGLVAIATNEMLLFYGSDSINASKVIGTIDHIFDSSYTKILKPDRRAYACVTAGLGVAPADVVFIDDQIRNVEGADRIGMHGIHLDIRDPAHAYTLALGLMGLSD